MNSQPTRLTVVDALRGFAIVSIMLLHNIEHFDFLYWPDTLPAWMVSTDKIIMDTLYFLFGGKSYAIFALLFGLTFYIQSANQEKTGNDFRGRFAWRLLLLMGFALVNSAFYEGDILSIYAVLGLFLIPVARLKTQWVVAIATFLMLQPVEWGKFLLALQKPETPMADPASWAYFGKAAEYITNDSMIDTLIGNLTNGKKAVLLWSWEQGRILQNISLFMFGMLAGRKKLFTNTSESKRFWQYTLPIAAASFIVLFQLRKQIPSWSQFEAIRRPLGTILTSYTNMALMMVWVSLFYLAFHSRFFHKALDVLSPMGKMSLSNYMMQSLIGAILYYGFGFGLYKYTGAFYCLLIGILLAALQWLFSRWWMSKHKQGPLEILWHKATWLGSRNQ